MVEEDILSKKVDIVLGNLEVAFKRAIGVDSHLPATDALRFPGSPAKTNVALRTLRRMLSKAAEWNYLRHAPKLRLRKELGREALIDPEAEETPSVCEATA